MKVETKYGEFRQDSSGAWHYEVTKWAGDVYTAVHDARKFCPKGTIWFWFNKMPAPMLPEDTASSLYGRWSDWADAYRNKNVDVFMEHLKEMFTSSKAPS